MPITSNQYMGEQITKELITVEKSNKLYRAGYTRVEVKLKRRNWLTKALEDGVCDKCGRNNTLTIDHIIPISILEDLGKDFYDQYDEDNLRLLCRPCNTMKANHLDVSTVRTKDLLIKYLNEISF